jgi:hypothetical protein
MVVEICLHKAKFSRFPKNVQVYDDLRIASWKTVRTSRRAGVNRWRLAVARAFKHQGEK